MTHEKIYDQPSKVSAKDGVVSIVGPDAVDVRLTPEAADETSDRLLLGALKAKGQQIAQTPRKNR